MHSKESATGNMQSPQETARSPQETARFPQETDYFDSIGDFVLNVRITMFPIIRTPIR
jgi:hypothetical protein